MDFALGLVLMLGGIFVAAGLGILIGWRVLNANERTVKIVNWCYVAAVLLIMAVAVILVVPLFFTSGPVNPTAVLPFWLVIGNLYMTFVAAGVVRGLSIQKEGRWV